MKHYIHSTMSVCTLQWLGSEPCFGVSSNHTKWRRYLRNLHTALPRFNNISTSVFPESSSQVDDKFEGKKKKLNKITDMTLAFELSKHIVWV